MKKEDFPPVNTHEFTLKSLFLLEKDLKKVNSKIRRINMKSKIRLIAGSVILYYMYNNLNEKILMVKEEMNK